MTRGFLLTGALTAAAVTLLVAGCKSSGSGPDQITLNGAGSTYAYPLYSAWISEYAKLHPGLQINYQSIGSAEGIRQVSEGTVDFGATDGPMNDQQLADAKTKRATNILHFPGALALWAQLCLSINVRGSKPTCTSPRALLPESFSAKSRNGMILRSRRLTQA
jgi:ABC-type phosphate transport system substrate-binding protein